jgi:hypothetical protein
VPAEAGGSVLARPLDPIDAAGAGDGKDAIERYVVHVDHEILAGPPRIRRDQAIAAEEGDGSADLLSALIANRLVSLVLDAKRGEVSADQSKRLCGLDGECVEVDWSLGDWSELAPVEGDLGQRPVALEAGVENGWATMRRPSPTSGRSNQRVIAWDRGAKYAAAEGRHRSAGQRVDERGVLVQRALPNQAKTLSLS